ncbi:MAG: replication factor C large subunit [Candidatus Aenigmarchaeota archaeon]|nr:replication factor C large subunit [Candidatus Aenigmarchaeota archaeon]
MQWVNKYKPKTASEVVGHNSVIEKLKQWLPTWKKGDKCLLIHGPPGYGKSAMVAALAKDFELDLFEMNGSDERTAGAIKRVLTPAIKQGSLFGRKRLIVVDEVDGLSGFDRGAVSELSKIMDQSKFPIIFLANDAYDTRIKPLRLKCELIQLRKVPYTSITKRLLEICEKENIEADPLIVKQIALSAAGDIRSAINDIETISCGHSKIVDSTVLGFRERGKNIFDVMKIVFRASTMKTAIESMYQCDKDSNEIFWWVEQNICNEFKDSREISDAYNILSKADVFRGRIMKNQNYRFAKYMVDMLASISSVRRNKPSGFVMYRPSDRIIIMGRTKAMRREREEKYSELGSYMHCSKKKVASQIHLLDVILKDN